MTGLEIITACYAFVIWLLPNWVLGIMGIVAFYFEITTRYYIRVHAASFYRRVFLPAALFSVAAMEISFELQDITRTHQHMMQGVAVSRLVIGWLLHAIISVNVSARRNYKKYAERNRTNN